MDASCLFQLLRCLFDTWLEAEWPQKGRSFGGIDFIVRVERMVPAQLADKIKKERRSVRTPSVAGRNQNESGSYKS